MVCCPAQCLPARRRRLLAEYRFSECGYRQGCSPSLQERPFSGVYVMRSRKLAARRRAEECYKRALDTKDRVEKVALVKIAGDWLEKATDDEEHDKNLISAQPAPPDQKPEKPA